MGAKGYKIRLAYKLNDGTRLSIPCKMVGIKSKDIVPKPVIKRKDATGIPISNDGHKTSVMRESLGKYMQSKNPRDIESSSGKSTPVYINEMGHVVDERDVKLFYIEPETGAEIEVDPLDPTIGRGQEVEVISMPDSSEKDSFLIDKVYIVTCDPQDAPALYKLADELDKDGKMAVIDVVVSESFEKFVGMIVPSVDRTSNKFALTVYVSRARFEPEWMEATPPQAVPLPGKKSKGKGKEIKLPGAAEMFK